MSLSRHSRATKQMLELNPNFDANARYCPKCGSDWRGKEIPEGDRTFFGGSTHFHRLIGIAVLGKYDGVWEWRCPDCDSRWPRFDPKSARNELHRKP